ncbi:MAG TPA: GNAT family N-acetyltransferase [Puia sp.]|nr:GNAT family N-acetyltransferase [Puia sp.]
MALLRSQRWGTVCYWENRIISYMRGELNPQLALPQRIAYIATGEGKVVGLIAGHLTSRFGCQAELEWIDVDLDWRGKGISTQLLHYLAAWFVEHSALHVCVNCASDNLPAQHFYRRNGAVTLSEHWLVWKDISSLPVP